MLIEGGSDFDNSVTFRLQYFHFFKKWKKQKIETFFAYAPLPLITLGFWKLTDFIFNIHYYFVSNMSKAFLE